MPVGWTERVDAATLGAFLDDVIEHPDDDAPRLVLADWLDDCGVSDVAQWLRLQCRHAGWMRLRKAERLRRMTTEQDEVRRIREELKGLRGVVLPERFRQAGYATHRGFLHNPPLYWPQLEDCPDGPYWSACATVRAWCGMKYAPLPAAGARVGGLHLSLYRKPGDDVCAAVGSFRGLLRLRLYMTCLPRDRGLPAVLRAAGGLPLLRELHLSSWGSLLGRDDLLTLAGRPWPSLRRLDISSCRADPDLGPRPWLWVAGALRHSRIPRGCRLALHKDSLGEPQAGALLTNGGRFVLE